jgi:hypothetical protein
MKITWLVLCLLVALACPPGAPAKEPAKSTKPAAKMDFLKIPMGFLVTRILQSTSGPQLSYRVVITIPPTANAKAAQARVTQSCGRSEIDAIAFDYAREMVKTPNLRSLVGTKELVFPLLVVPPALDSSLRSEAGKRPIPPDREVSFPSAGVVEYDQDVQVHPTQSYDGKMRIMFPPQGGYPKEVCILSPSGSPTTDKFFLRFRLSNWQVRRTSTKPQFLDFDFGVGRDVHRPLSW